MDDGLFLENVPDEVQPGNNVRRVNGKRLTDEEMIDYYIGLVNQYGVNGKLKGYFLKGVAICDKEQVYTYDRKSDRCFLNRRSSVINEGYPLGSLWFIESLNKFKSELTEEEEKTTVDIENDGIFNFILNTISVISQNKEK